MTTTNKKAKVTSENKAEAEALRRIWGATEHASQAAFGELYDIGNQSAVGQFLRGEVPLSLKAAQGFARGLNCSIGDFSPRLASMVGGIASLIDMQKHLKELATEGGIAGLVDVESYVVVAPGDDYISDNEKSLSEHSQIKQVFVTVEQAFEILGKSLRRLDEIGRKQAQPLFDALIQHPEKALELGMRYNVIATTNLPAKPQLTESEAEFATKTTKLIRDGKLKYKSPQTKTTTGDS